MESFTITEDLSLYGSQQPLDLCNGCCLVILLKGIVLTAAIYGLSRQRPPDSRLRSLLDPFLYIEVQLNIHGEERSLGVIQLAIVVSPIGKYFLEAWLAWTSMQKSAQHPQEALGGATIAHCNTLCLGKIHRMPSDNVVATCLSPMGS